jgi:hypothetical protein
MPERETDQCANPRLGIHYGDSKEVSGSVTRATNPRVAHPTPDQDNENHRTAKRPRSESPEVTIDPSEYRQYDGRTSSQAWLMTIAKQMTHWVHSCVSLNDKCQNIPLIVVVKLALAILQ